MGAHRGSAPCRHSRLSRGHARNYPKARRPGEGRRHDEDYQVTHRRGGVRRGRRTHRCGFRRYRGVGLRRADRTGVRGSQFHDDFGTFVVQLGSRSPAMLATSTSACRSCRAADSSGYRRSPTRDGSRAASGFADRCRRTRRPSRSSIVDEGDRLEHDGEIYPLPLPEQQWRCPATDGEPAARAGLRGGDGAAKPGSPVRWPTARSAMRRSGSRRGVARPAREGAEGLDGPFRTSISSRPSPVESTTTTRPPTPRHAATPMDMPSPSVQWGRSDRNFYNDAFTRLGYGEQSGIVATVAQREARRSPPSGADRPRPPHESGWHT